MKDDIGALWKELSLTLKTFILKKVGNEHDAEDILQDVFLKIFANLDQLKDDKKYMRGFIR